MKPRIISIDLETYSDVDLGKCGVYRYVEGDFHILLFAYAFDDEAVEIIDMASGETLPDEVLDAISDSEIIKSAWNAAFERTCIGRMLGRTLYPDDWKCSMVWAASLSLPLALKNAAAVLKTGEQKDRAGENLIRFFSVPCKPTATNGGRTRNLPLHAPEKWAQFKEYCLQDVRTERDIRKKLERFPMPGFEWDYYHLDQRINDRGVMIDTALVEQAIICDRKLTAEMTDAAYALTGLENPNSVMQLKGWLDEQGITVETLDKKGVAKLIEEYGGDDGRGQVLEMLKLRLMMAKSSVKKYEAAARFTCQDQRAHGLFQFNGANRTGRFSGRGIQLQNLPQNHISTLDEARELLKAGEFEMLSLIYGNVPDILSQLLRTMLIAKPGHEFIIVDFSAIEARLLAWEAGEKWVLDAFSRGADIYCETASRMFHVPVIKHGANGELRQRGKQATLSCGYGGGVGALKKMGALEAGMREDELDPLVKAWREANPKIVQYWWDIDRAANDTFKDGTDHAVGKLNFQYSANTLWMVLPSGRRLAYCSPHLQPNQFGRMSMTYMGVDAANKWGRIATYGPKLVENATQAIARDILCEAMWRMERKGLCIVAHVHDEVIIEAPKGQYSVEEICDIMNERPEWGQDIPLSSAGYTGEHYFKD
jgi:DNA polymerase